MIDRQFRIARIWSNDELRKVGHIFTGSAVNVSGWRDEDKEGRTYKSYFPNCTSYAITNYGGIRGTGPENELTLDLERALPQEMVQAFDLVFNHTTLEHIFDVNTAFANLCSMARELVVVVVPFAQVEHFTESFGDYWRFSPQALTRMFEVNGFSPIYTAVSPAANAGVYILAVGAKHPELWVGRFPETKLPRFAGQWIGRRRTLGSLFGNLGPWLRKLQRDRIA